MTEPVEIGVQEALERVAGGALLLDVREHSEWVDGHAPQAQLLPLSELGERWTELDDADAPVVVVCHSGYRSLNAAAFLEQSGVHAVSVAGGMVAWAEAGGPVIRDDTHAVGERDSAE